MEICVSVCRIWLELGCPHTLVMNLRAVDLPAALCPTMLYSTPLYSVRANSGAAKPISAANWNASLLGILLYTENAFFHSSSDPKLAAALAASFKKDAYV